MTEEEKDKKEIEEWEEFQKKYPDLTAELIIRYLEEHGTKKESYEEEDPFADYKKEKRKEFYSRLFTVFALVLFVFAIFTPIVMSFYAHRRIDSLQDKIEKLQVKKRVNPEFINE